MPPVVGTIRRRSEYSVDGRRYVGYLPMVLTVADQVILRRCDCPKVQGDKLAGFRSSCYSFEIKDQGSITELQSRGLGERFPASGASNAERTIYRIRMQLGWCGGRVEIGEAKRKSQLSPNHLPAPVD